MKIARCQWDRENLAHCAQHQVEPDEVEEVLVGQPYIRKTRQGRYLAYGTTVAGRYVVTVFRHQGRGVARVFTARDMTGKERRLYRQRRR